MTLKFRFVLCWPLLALALALMACSAKRTVRMPSYWPEARAQTAETTNQSEESTRREASAGDETQGLASWYGEPYHGNKTASGETYNMNALTAAHKKLPFDTRVRVTSLDSKKDIVVRINDRGPFVSGRIIDLSREAAKRIGLIRPGVAPVRLETVPAHALPTEHSAKYTVQVGYFTQRANAVKLVGQLRSRFSEVSVEPVAARAYRVQVGSVDTRSEAERLQEQLRGENLHAFIRILE